MRHLFTLVLGLSILTINAQNSSFVNALGGTDDEVAVDMVQVASGDYYLLANTSSYGQGDRDIYLARTNGLGEVTWAYAYGTSADEYATSLTLLSDGGLLITAVSDGFIGNYDAGLLLKVNSSGAISWSKVLSTDSTLRLHDAVQANTGNIYVTGTINIDSLENNVLLTNLNNSGNFFWSKTYGGINDDEGYSIDVDAANRLIIAGTTMNDSIVNGSSGDVDIQLLRILANGNVDWINNYGTVSKEVATKVRAKGANYYLAGYTEGSIDLSEDALVMKVDTFGDINYSQSFFAAVDDRATDLYVNNDGSVGVIGYLEGFTTVRDIMAIELNSNGGLTSTFVFGGDSTDGGSAAIAKSLESGYSIFSSGGTYRSNGDDDLYLIKTESDFSTGCGQVFQPISEAAQIMNDNSHTYTSNLSLGGNTTISRTTITESDTSLCCQLEARVAGDTITICEGDVLALGASSISGYKYSWTAIGSTYNSTNANPQVSPESDTEYKLVVSDSEGNCTSDSAVIYVIVNDRVDGIDFARDSFFCAGEDVSISAHPGFSSYQWLGDGYSFSGANVTFDEQDTILLTVIASNGCIYYDTIAILEKAIPVFSLGPDSTICENLSIVLSGPPNMASYTWNGQTGSNQNFETSVQQIHGLVVVDSFGCTYSDNVVIQTVPFASFDLGIDTSFCEGGFFTIIGPGALSGYIWNDTASSSANLTVFEAGTYRLTAFNSYNCPFTDTIVLSELPQPQFSLGADTGYCEGGSLVLNGPTGLEDYLWTGGSDQSNLTVSSQGSYSLRVTDDQGCRFIDTIEVEEYSNPIISLGPDTTICIGESITLDPGSGYADYDWSTGVSTQSIVVDSKGTFSVTVTDINGCEGTASVDVDTVTCGTESIFLLGTESIRFYPNPTADYLLIEGESSLAGADISLQNAMGQVLIQVQNKDHSLRLDLSNLPNGSYVLGLKKDNNQVYKRVIVSH